MSGKNVELGTVGFNLEAHDDALLESLETLRKFGDQVTKAANLTDEAGQRQYATYTKIERVLTSAFDRVSALTDKLVGVSAGEEAVSKLTQQYQALVDVVTKTGGGMESHEFVRAQVGLAAAAQQATRAIQEQVSTTALLEQRQNALVAAWERTANIESRLKSRGASETDIERFAPIYTKFAAALDTADLSTIKLKEAQREYNMELGQTTREIRENLAAAATAQQQQTRLIGATRNVQYMNARVMRSNIPNSFADENNAALSGLGVALQGGKQNDIIAAQQKLNDAMLATRVAMAGAEKPTSALSLAMHDLSKATTLALGPLSGVGSRIAVMTSLLDSNTVGMALFVGGAVAMGTALFKVSENAIAATSAQQKFDAILTTSAGSATLVGQEYDFVLKSANKLGLEVKGLVEPYARFTAAARLNNVSMQDQRKIYEAITVTAAANRWSTEQTGRAFLAFEQMLDKTTVQSEELKKQLGQLIPGIFELGAAAMKIDPGQLVAMMKAGTLMSKVFEPALAQKMMDTFGPGAQKGAETLSAKVNVLGNSMFEFWKAVDEATGFSKVWTLAIIEVTKAIDYMRTHMSDLMAVMAAFAGAGAGYAVLRLLIALPAIIATVIGALTGLRTAIIAIETTTIIGFLVKMGAALIGAGVAYAYFKDKTNEAKLAGDDLTGRMQEWIDQQNKLGETQGQVQKRMVEQAKGRLEEISRTFGDQSAILRKMEQSYVPNPIASHKPGEKVSVDTDPQVKAQRDKVAAIGVQYEAMRKILGELDQLKIATETEPKPPENKKWETWVQKITKDIEVAKGKVSELDAVKVGGEDARMFAEALTKAKEVMLAMPKEGGPMGQVVEKLKAAGYEGKTVVEQLQQMFYAQEKATAGIRDYGKEQTHQLALAKDIKKAMDDLSERERAANGQVEGLGATREKNARLLAKNMDDLRTSLVGIGNTEEENDAVLAAYAKRWVAMVGVEEHTAAVQRVTKELEKMGLHIGDAATRIRAAATAEIAIVQEGVKLKIITEQQGAEQIVKINEDMYNKLTVRTDEWYGFYKKMVGHIETELANAFADTNGGIGKNFSKILDNIWGQVVAFMVKMAIIRPLMAKLFGSEASGKSTDGTGVLGGLIIRLGSLFMGANTGSGPIDPATTAGDYQNQMDLGNAPPPGRAVGGSVNPFSDYLVGENGPERLSMGGMSGHITPLSQVRNSGMDYQDNSKHVYNIDGRTDIAFTMQLISQSQRANNDRLQRELKVRYG